MQQAGIGVQKGEECDVIACLLMANKLPEFPVSGAEHGELVCVVVPPDDVFSELVVARFQSS